MLFRSAEVIEVIIRVESEMIDLTPGSPQRKEIEKALADYRSYISETFPSEIASMVNRLSDASVFLPGTGDEKSAVSLLTALHSLSMMKNSVLMAENALLRTLADSNN